MGIGLDFMIFHRLPSIPKLEDVNIREDVKIYNSWLQPKSCSTQQFCVAFPS